GPNAQPIVTKVVYRHMGYSDLGEDVISKTPMMQISAKRDSACDETYDSFVQSSPTLREEQTNAQLGEKIVFIGPFQTTKLPPTQLLKCYTFQTGNFRIEPQSGEAVPANQPGGTLNPKSDAPSKPTTR